MLVKFKESEGAGTARALRIVLAAIEQKDHFRLLAIIAPDRTHSVRSNSGTRTRQCIARLKVAELFPMRLCELHMYAWIRVTRHPNQKPRGQHIPASQTFASRPP